MIHGAARGADHIANNWANKHHQPKASFPANWLVFAKQAGPRRNRQMFWTLRPDAVLAFPLNGSVGTWDMVRIAEDNGCPVDVRSRL